MKVYHSIKDFAEKDRCTILTIGTFDGVHLGHQKIIQRLNRIKAEENGKTAILTFFPHPRRVLNRGNEIKMLTTIDEKIDLLDKLGLDFLIIEPFTKEFSDLPAREFVKDLLVDQLKIKILVIGYDHQFGKNREGDYEQMKEFGEEFGFRLEKIPVHDFENVAISSTKIRKALENGNIEKANQYLGYEYFLTGEVIKGQGLGKKMSYPTINIHISEDYKLIPKTGVYTVKTRIGKKTVFGIMNIGFRPTVDGKYQTIEVHLLDFNADLYGENIRIRMLKRIREEKKFESLEALTKQIRKDEETAREWLGIKLIS
ncbi:MAG: riboflavin biosynthesis protein RibF [Flavobacteriia bacterium]|nr:MAG: riboflavin biosynthesis protein RibF [Flavobacteriia bacterium]